MSSRKRSRYFNGRQFLNPYGDNNKSFADFVKWQRTKNRKVWPRWIDDNLPWQPIAHLKRGQFAVHFVNHATVLIEFELGSPGEPSRRFRILTDPVWSQRVSPLSFAGPSRVRAPGIPFDLLPPIDLILVSHNHYDHLDTRTLRRLAAREAPMILCALGDEELIQSAVEGANPNSRDSRVVGMDWWESCELNSQEDAIRVTYTPANHWSGRGMLDRFANFWGGFYIRIPSLIASPTVFFAGDTGYARHFSEIHEVLGPPDLALLPIGAYEPRWFMQGSHMNPKDAVRAHLDLHARHSMGIHFGTWQLTDEGIDEPVLDLENARRESGLSPEDFFVLQHGAQWITGDER